MQINQSHVVVKTLAGSRLFGVHTPTSDYDYKVVFAHNLDGLIRGDSDTDRTKDLGANSETEYFSIKKFSTLASQNQTIALEMLFTPANFVLSNSDTWEELVANRDRIVSKHIMPFVGYAKNQAEIYSNKGNRLQFLQEFDIFLQEFIRTHAKSYHDKAIAFVDYLHQSELAARWESEKLLSWDSREQPNGSSVRLVTLLNKAYEETLLFQVWDERLQAQLKEYGDRAKQAQDKKGFDTKATYHAYRVVQEAIELLKYGKLTFPRPEVEMLKRIRANEFTRDYLCEEISANIALLNELLVTSSVRDLPDTCYLNSWTLSSQRKYILSELNNVRRY